jgi:glycosyltransferase involved in cell wall biosynthesis
MRVLFTCGLGYLPQRSGGAQSSTDQLANALKRAGHEPAVLTSLEPGGHLVWQSKLKRKLTGRKFSRDCFMGYPVFRAWHPSDTTEVVQRFRPDVAVVQNGFMVPIADSLQKQGVPVVLYFRNVEFGEMGGDLNTLGPANYISNSNFTARRYFDAYRIDSTVIPPLIEPEKYRASSTRANVTLINPSPLKGGNLAIEIAALCPEIPFVFVQSWKLHDDTHTTLLEKVAQVPNITLQPRTDDMKSVYGQTRILLAPSQWEEAWGRVASEAHCSGIPVLGTNRGGLPEAIGPGGVILAHDAPPQDWAAALRRIWEDQEYYDQLSLAARDFARRPEIVPESQFKTFLKIIEKARTRL